MDGWWNAKSLLFSSVLLAGAALVPVGALHADMLTSAAPPTSAAGAPHAAGLPHRFVAPATPPVARPITAAQVNALLRSLGQGWAELQEDLARELVATQATLFFGYFPPVPKKKNESPPPAAPPGGSQSPPPTAPPPPPGNTPPPPPPAPPPPSGSGGPPGGNGPPPPPPNVTPEPASMVTALLGVGLASLAAWRHRRRKQRDGAGDEAPCI